MLLILYYGRHFHFYLFHALCKQFYARQLVAEVFFQSLFEKKY